MERWRDIPGYEGIYEASTLGRIRTKEGKTTWSSRFNCNRVWKQRVLKPKISTNKRGRRDARVDLYKGGKGKTWLVARLVGLAWCDGYAEGMTINHIDGNSLNNSAENLEWLTRDENIRHGIRTGLYSISTKTTLISAADKSEYEFSSETDAARFLGRSEKYINTCLRKGQNARATNGEIFYISQK